MFDSLKSKIAGVGTALVLAGQSFASEGGESGSDAATVNWSSIADTAENSFGTVVSNIAPVAIGVVILVAGVRVFIKLINRGAGK